MPHPERSFLAWQWPWIPLDIKKLQEMKVSQGVSPGVPKGFSSGVSPWIKMFQNARQWCEQ